MQERSSAYKDAGVDLQAANTLVQRIKSMAASTHTKGVITDIGLFAGMFKLDVQDMKHPVLVSSTDGVGTKLKLAFAMNQHDTIGIDLVAMNVNDIVVHGAQPLFFLDYLACGKLEVEQAEQIISGIVQGCKQAGCALLGGETAELPGFYPDKEYDISGFCVGLVDDAKIVDGSSIGVGNKIIGLASSGLHSNGYSLVHKLLSEQDLQLTDILPGTKQEVGKLLLEPTRIYVRTVLNLIRDFEIKGMVHITGGGFYDNLPRVLPKGVKAQMEFNSWPQGSLLQWLQQSGDLSWEEMLQIFNCGIGLVLIVSQKDYEDILIRLQGLKEKAWVIGEIRSRKSGEEQVEFLF
ncbi:MAG: phosphoribosylformylglycinamidine cyclo-ligase [Thermodesulfobacteriota bacterium]